MSKLGFASTLEGRAAIVAACEHFKTSNSLCLVLEQELSDAR